MMEISDQHAIPPMPVHSVDGPMLLVYVYGMAAFTGALFLWWFLSSEKNTHGFILPVALIGGAAAALIEPIIDVLALVWYPRSDYLIFIEAFGRDVPLLAPLGYAWYVGGLAYLVYRLLVLGVRGQIWWWIFTVIFIFDCVAISIAVFMDLLGFYGNQPFYLWGYPLWWAAIDSPQPLIAGLMMYWFLPRLQHTRTKLLFVFLVPPISMGAITGAAIFPVALALNTAQSGLLSYVGGGATLALGTFVAWICITLMNAQESHKPT
jgi:hypothetical protein